MTVKPDDWEGLGKQIADRTREIAAEAVGGFERRAETLTKTLLGEAAALREESDAIRAALATSDLPKVMKLLQAAQDHAAEMLTEELRRKADLMRMDGEARKLLAEQDQHLTDLRKLHRDFLDAATEIAAWKQRAADDLAQALAAVDKSREAASEIVADLAAETEALHKRIEAEQVTFMDLTDLSVQKAVQTVDSAVAAARAAAEAMQAERRSVSASRAHVTKALDTLREEADAFFLDLRDRGMAEVRKVAEELLPTDIPPADQPALPFEGMRWRGIWDAARPYLRGDVVTWGATTWVADRATRGRPGDSPDWQVMAAGQGGGFTKYRENTAGAQPPAAFFQDAAPDPNLPNWLGTTGTRAHVRLWVRTTDMRLFAAVPDASNQWTWAAIVGTI